MMSTIKNLLRRNQVILKTYRNLKRRRFHPTANLLQANDQIGLTMKWLKKLPNNFDLVIGIQRSGVIIANAIALQFCIPWSIPSCFIENKQVFYTTSQKTPAIKRVLIVEDRVNVGREINSVKAAIQTKYPELTVKTASLLINNRSAHAVDYYYQNTEQQAIEQIWDLLKVCKREYVVDMDGVLTVDPTERDLADQESYLSYVVNAQPYLLIRSEINTIVTSRPEWVRKETEDWLTKNGLKYNHLIMLQTQMGHAPSTQAAVAHKVAALKRITPDIYWESNYEQAKAIHKQTGIKVLCTDKMVMFGL
jgi:orotate phosphoribosyltransferase